MDVFAIYIYIYFSNWELEYSCVLRSDQMKGAPYGPLREVISLACNAVSDLPMPNDCKRCLNPPKRKAPLASNIRLHGTHMLHFD